MSTAHGHAQERADAGIASSAQHADEVHESWVAQAAEALGWAASQSVRGLKFTVEDLRGHPTIVRMLPPPPDLRSWGAATRRATKLGYIVKTDEYALAASSNNSPKPLYRAGVWREADHVS